VRDPVVAGVVLVGAGAAWMATMSTINTAAQTAVSAWVRARALAVSLLVIQGSMAAGALAWGSVAVHTGIPTALLIAAAGPPAGAGGGSRLGPPLPAGPGRAALPPPRGPGARAGHRRRHAVGRRRPRARHDRVPRRPRARRQVRRRDPAARPHPTPRRRRALGC